MYKNMKAAIFFITMIILSLYLVGCSKFSFPGSKEKVNSVYSGTAEAEEYNIPSELSGKIKELKIQEGQNVSTGDLIAVLESSENNAKLELAKISLKNALNELDKLNDAGASEKAKNTAQYGVDTASKNVELAKLTLDKCNITSENSGIVETVNFKQGEYVTPGNPIVTLLDTKNMYVKIYVHEKELTSLKLGREVNLKSDFIKDKTIKGQVTYISSEAEFTPMNIVTKEDRMKLVFAVKIKILDNVDSIKPGMLIDVNMQ